MRTCVLSVSSMVGQLVCLLIPGLRLGTLVPRQKVSASSNLLYGANCRAKMRENSAFVFSVKASESRCLQSNSDERAYYMSAHARPLL